MVVNSSPKAGGVSSSSPSTTTASTKSVVRNKPRTGKKAGGASTSSKAAIHQSNNGFACCAAFTIRGTAIALFVILYICVVLTFCIQVFVWPSKLSGLSGLATQTIVPQSHQTAFIPQAALTTTTTTMRRTTTTTTTTSLGDNCGQDVTNNDVTNGSINLLQLDPSTIQSLYGMTEQQIRKVLGNEVQIQFQDQHGRIIEAKAKVDVQTTATTTATIVNHNRNVDVTVHYDVYDGMAVYHCPTAMINNAPAHDVVLLNAGRYLSPDHFNKTTRTTIVEHQYREKVFLDLCLHAARGKRVTSVTALDVPAAINPHRLLSILQLLHQRRRIQRLPVAALITPGQSADTVVDWILYGDDIGILQHQITERWIPVASERVLELDIDDEDDSFADEITENASTPLRNGALDLVRGWPVLAVYGADDILARQGAELVERRLQAKTISLPGGDDCHEHATDTFAAAVMDYLAKQIKSSSSSPTHRATGAASMTTTTATTAIPTTASGIQHFSIQLTTLL